MKLIKTRLYAARGRIYGTDKPYHLALCSWFIESDDVPRLPRYKSNDMDQYIRFHFALVCSF